MHTDLCTHRPAGVCDIVVPCKSTPVPFSSPVAAAPRSRRSVDRVNRVKSTRHASRSNRLTGLAPLYGPARASRSQRIPLRGCAQVHIDDRAHLSRRRAPTHIIPENTLGRKVYFLPRRAMQPAVAFARIMPRKLNEKTSSCRRSTARRNGGCADANRGSTKFVARRNSRSEVGRERRKKERVRESYFDFTSGAICVRKSRRDASNMRDIAHYS